MGKQTGSLHVQPDRDRGLFCYLHLRKQTHDLPGYADRGDPMDQ